MSKRTQAKPMSQQSIRPLRLRDTISVFAVPAVGLAIWSFANRHLPSGSYVPWAFTLLGPLLGTAIGALLVFLLRLILGNSCALLINAMGIMLYSIAMFGPSLLRYVNMGLDNSPATAYNLTVVEYTYHRKGSDTVVFRHWSDPGDTFKVDGTYQEGSSVQILVHEGLLGLTWIETPLDATINQMKRGQ